MDTETMAARIAAKYEDAKEMGHGAADEEWVCDQIRKMSFADLIDEDVAARLDEDGCHGAAKCVREAIG